MDFLYVDSTGANYQQSGPVEAPKRKSRVFEGLHHRPKRAATPSSGSEDSPNSDPSSGASSSDIAEPQNHVERPRKRRRVDTDNLEASYFQRLAKEEEREELQRRPRRSQSPSQYLADLEDDAPGVPEDDSSLPVHESLTQETQGIDKDRAKRTVFLSNVSIDAIKSKSSRKELLSHLAGALKTAEKIETIRFRSTAYTGGGAPKKAGFATKDLMEQTTKNTNAYAVLSSESAATSVAKKLNGTVVLNRHLRADNLANPSAVDHKRCVFVGNLNFVDEETTDGIGPNGEEIPRRPKAKQPADAEEGLWRTFSKVGKVENVRVVRDKHTRVGKGFAYVQFADENGVEAALLLDDKKFPPLLPRKLRVSRAKKVQKRSQPSRERPSSGFRGTASKMGRSSQAIAQGSFNKPGNTTKFVFEGHRATKISSKDSKERKRRTVKPTGRSAKRGATFKVSGGAKKRDRKP